MEGTRRGGEGANFCPIFFLLKNFVGAANLKKGQ